MNLGQCVFARKSIYRLNQAEAKRAKAALRAICQSAQIASAQARDMHARYQRLSYRGSAFSDPFWESFQFGFVENEFPAKLRRAL